MNEVTFGSRLRGLALALLNATLLLAVLLVFGLWLLIGRVQHLAADTALAVTQAVGPEVRARAAQEISGLGATIERVKGLEGRVTDALGRVSSADSAAGAELRGLRTDIQALTATLGGVRGDLDGLAGRAGQSLTAALQQILTELAARLGAALPNSISTPISTRTP